MDTIFAVSSGAPPAAIAVLRISGPGCASVAKAFHDGLPEPRRASLRAIKDASGDTLDDALTLWFPGPDSATGEDLLEWHLHGGRAVVRAVEAALAAQPDLRPAEPGEFTRRAFANGRIDLAEAEGLADLLSAETESQRLNAIRMAGGQISSQVNSWTDQLLDLSARIEAAIDFDDEDDVSPLPRAELDSRIAALADEIAALLDRPSAERIKDGIRVVLAGPPNAGKSSLFNAILQRDAAIVADIAGTTRDVIEAPVALGGMAFVLADTAGLHEGTGDSIEAEGMARARGVMDGADLILWLGPAADKPEGAILIQTKADLETQEVQAYGALSVSTKTGQDIDKIIEILIERGKAVVPQDGVSANQRQRGLLAEALAAVREAMGEADLLVIAEHFRQARGAFDSLTGRASTEAMLDALFGRFCIGK